MGLMENGFIDLIDNREHVKSPPQIQRQTVTKHLLYSPHELMLHRNPKPCELTGKQHPLSLYPGSGGDSLPSLG